MPSAPAFPPHPWPAYWAGRGAALRRAFSWPPRPPRRSFSLRFPVPPCQPQRFGSVFRKDRSGGYGAEGIHVALLGTAVDLFPELFGTATGQRVLDGQRAAQAHHVRSGITALDTLPARVLGPVFFQCGNLLFAAQLLGQGLGHVMTPSVD